MSSDIDRLMLRTRQYWYADGVPEIAVGAFLLATGLLFALEAVATPGTPLSHVTAYGLPILLVGGAFGFGRLVRKIKMRLTYPRTGYVAYAKPSGMRRVSTALIAVAGAGMLAYAAARLRLEGSQTLLITAVCAAILIAVAGMGLLRFYAIAALTVGLGLVLHRAAGGVTRGTAILFGFVGAAFVLSGGITLARYLKRTAPPPEDPS